MRTDHYNSHFATFTFAQLFISLSQVIIYNTTSHLALRCYISRFSSFTLPYHQLLFRTSWMSKNTTLRSILLQICFKHFYPVTHLAPDAKVFFYDLPCEHLESSLEYLRLGPPQLPDLDEEVIDWPLKIPARDDFWPSLPVPMPLAPVGQRAIPSESSSVFNHHRLTS